MNQLVLKSVLAPDTNRLEIRPTFSGRVQLIIVDSYTSAGCTLSNPDAYRLRDFLNKELGEQAPEPNKPAKAPQLILAWQHPANGRRFMQVSSELVATQSAVELRRNQPDFPIWLAQITKQHVQPNPSYEWKEIG